MSDTQPLVTLGMPVYNGERYLADALDSLINQDYENFELIISDNASSDSTEAICRSYAARDPRIRYSRNESNVGAAKNQAKLFELAAGKYFLLCAHDDLRAAAYVSECVAVLERNPAAVCCCTETVFIDENGKVVAPGYGQGHTNFGSPSLSRRQRVRYLFAAPGTSYYYYGMMRSEAFRKTGPIENLLGLDLIILLKLSLGGPIIRIPKPLFFYRIFPQKTTKSIMQAVDASNMEEIDRPYLDILRASLRVVWESDVGLWERVSLCGEVITSFCFRNWLFRRMIGQESVNGVAAGIRRRRIKPILSLIFFCPLALPEVFRRWRDVNEGRLIASYQEKHYGAFLTRLPLYVLLAPAKLLKREAWSAAAGLFRHTRENL